MQTMALLVMMIAFSPDVLQVRDVLSHIQDIPSFKPQAGELFYMLTSWFFWLWKRHIIPQRCKILSTYSVSRYHDCNML